MDEQTKHKWGMETIGLFVDEYILDDAGRALCYPACLPNATTGLLHIVYRFIVIGLYKSYFLQIEEQFMKCTQWYNN
jgi:hypothetical protein